MLKQLLPKHGFHRIWIYVLIAFLSFLPVYVNADTLNLEDNVTIDRIQLVSHQIHLLKNRLSQSERELNRLQQQQKESSLLAMDKVSKNQLNKTALDIAVANSNLESITIELNDSQQSISWLEKNIQEIENQLNVLSVFGRTVAKNDFVNQGELRADLKYQQKLLLLEKERETCLSALQNISTNILQIYKERHTKINALLKSRRLLHIKQQQVKDELAYQEQQNYWLMQLNSLYAHLAKISPTQKIAYTQVEREIFYANESAYFAYVQSLVARYKDQVQQMKLSVGKSNSIALLNEVGTQTQTLVKQVARLETILDARTTSLKKYINYLAQKINTTAANNEIEAEEDKRTHNQSYLQKLELLEKQYMTADRALAELQEEISIFRTTLDRALQNELSLRQGFPNFGAKTLLEFGKELLLVPTLTFQMLKSISHYFVQGVKSTSYVGWALFMFLQWLSILLFYFLRGLLSRVLQKPASWHEQLNSKWLSLKWLHHNFFDIWLLTNVFGIALFFKVPLQNFTFAIYLAMVWLVFRSIITIARLCLLETTHDDSGHDVRLYTRLKWMVIVGSIITALTVFMHQLPLIYELKTLFDCLFLLLLMIISLLLLKSWEVVPNLILSHMESQHPYLQKSIRLIGVLIPLLMFCNSAIGLFGYVNLVMTISWYEGIFLLVLIGYLFVRGLLSDGMEQLSRLVIQYTNNGWLLTEAFLKPIHKVLRITLFLMGWAVLFLLYGWDKQSPIVERLTRLLHYELINVLNTTITPLNIIELFVAISIFYWTAKWIREFVYRLLLSRTKDMGLRNSIAILSQYIIVVFGIFICLKVILGIDLSALAFVASAFAFGIGLGLRDLANNFACGFLILLERPIRVGDIVSVNNIEGEVSHIGNRAVTVKTWDHMELLVPNAEIFNKPFINWTAKDNIVRSVFSVKISRHDNPHQVRLLIQNVLDSHKEILSDPPAEIFLKEMNDHLIEFELRYFVNIRQVPSRISVMSSVLMSLWDSFAAHGIKPPFPHHEVSIVKHSPN